MSPRKATTSAARDVAGGTRLEVEIATQPEAVPGVLLLPTRTTPAPAALLLHGFGSRKERMADTVGKALLRRGIASLAIDLPLHGARAGNVQELSRSNPLALVRAWRGAVSEAGEALGFLAARHDVNPRRLALVGYSLGSFLACIVAADAPAVRAVVLAAGGDLPPRTPFAALVRTVADPIRAVRRLAGRPLLMVHGRYDRTVAPAQAKALFDAAAEPKAIRWYQGGHWPPVAEIDAAAEWLGAELSAPSARRQA